MTALLLLCLPTTPADAPFPLKSGDRVVLIGATAIEREQREGHWEAELNRRLPETPFTLRNLGWSGDNVWGESRAWFDPVERGYARLVEQALAFKPTAIVVNYGWGESYAGEAGLAAFEKQYERLLNDLSPANARVALLLPWLNEAVPKPLPDVAPSNARLEVYRARIRQIAERRKLVVLDLQPAISAICRAGRLTDNGVHLTPHGYRVTSGAFADFFARAAPPFNQGRYDELRRAVVEKNRNYFDKWRPQNDTYLYGFRKHEQGQNAKELAEFDPIIAKQESLIAELRRPSK